jgi:hypothetical protein
MPRKIPRLCPGGSCGRVPAAEPLVVWAGTGTTANRVKMTTVKTVIGKSSGFIGFSPYFSSRYGKDAHM